MAYIKIPLENILHVTKIVTLYYFEYYSPGYKTIGEAHDFWELVYVDSGELDLQGGDTVYHLNQGEIIFHSPNEFHRLMCDDRHSASVFIITFECDSPAMSFFENRHMAVPKDVKGLLNCLVKECTNTFHMSSYPLKINENTPIGGMQMVKNYLECFLISLMRNESCQMVEKEADAISDSQFENDLTEKITVYLKDNIYNKITLDDLSKKFHFSVSTICSVFHRNTGDTVMKYFMKLKINEAKRLMRETPYSISDILEKLGFESQQHFSRTFRKYVGESPRAFRNSVVKRISINSIKK